MPSYNSILVEILGEGNGIGLITLDRPKSANSFGDGLISELSQALRDLDNHPDTVFTVVTGSGRFFSAGLDIKSDTELYTAPPSGNDSKVKSHHMKEWISADIELMRLMIDHKKVLVMAVNGPAVGGGSGWFLGVSDLVYVAENAYMSIPFNSLGLVPEMGSAVMFPQSAGTRRPMEYLMFGTRVLATQMEDMGIANRIFPSPPSFLPAVLDLLHTALSQNDGTSLLETKRLITAPLREGRMLAAYRSMEALGERFVSGVPQRKLAKRGGEVGGSKGGKLGAKL